MKRLAIALMIVPALFLFVAPARAFFISYTFTADPLDQANAGKSVSGTIPQSFNTPEGGSLTWDKPKYLDVFAPISWDGVDWSNTDILLTASFGWDGVSLYTHLADWQLDTSALGIQDPFPGYSFNFFSKGGHFFYTDANGSWQGTGTWYISDSVPSIPEGSTWPLVAIGVASAIWPRTRQQRS